MKFKVKKSRFSKSIVLQVEGAVGDELDRKEIKYLNDASPEVFIPFTCEKKGKVYQLTYVLDGLIDMETLVKRPFELHQLRRVVTSVLQLVKSCDEGELERRRVASSAEHVFYDPSKGILRFVYVPFWGYVSGHGEADTLAYICSRAQVPSSDDWLRDAVLDYARCNPVIANVAYERFLKGLGLLSGRTQEPSLRGDIPEKQRKTEGLDKKQSYGWSFASQDAALSAVNTNQRIISGSVMLECPNIGRRFVLREGRYLIGRSDDCQISFPDRAEMSRKHALVTVSRNGCFIQDQSSTNGVFVRNHRLVASECASLSLGEEFLLGKERFVLREA